MRTRITTLSVGLLFAAAYAGPLPSPKIRLTSNEVDSMQAHDSGAGTSGVAGIRTTIIAGESDQGWPLHNPLERSSKHQDPGTYPPRRSHCHCDLWRMVLWLRPGRGRRDREGSAGRKFLHGARWCCALRGNQGGSRSRLHHRKRPDRHRLRQVTPAQVTSR